MKKVPYTNHTKHRDSIAGVAVRPGETIFVDERDHPDFKPAGAAPTEPSDPVLDLLDNNVGDIKAKLSELSDEDFYRLWQGEEDGKTRSTLLAAFEEEKLRRAEANAEGSGEGAGEGSDGKDEEQGE